MNNILDELGYPRGRQAKICLVAVFAIATLFFLVLGQFLQSVLGINPIIFHVIVWGGWFVWQGYFFARNRERYLRNNAANAYRAAFRQDIIPGVALGVAQMLRPPWQGYLIAPHFIDTPWLILGSAPLIAIGIGLLYMGFRTIGFDGAGFLYEYKTQSAPLTQQSIYAFIRHPLFLGGVFLSVGISLLSGGTVTLVMVAINVLILPVYSHLEDARLIRVFGVAYRDYKMHVGGLLPRPGILKKYGDATAVNPGWSHRESN